MTAESHKIKWEKGKKEVRKERIEEKKEEKKEKIASQHLIQVFFGDEIVQVLNYRKRKKKRRSHQKKKYEIISGIGII